MRGRAEASVGIALLVAAQNLGIMFYAVEKIVGRKVDRRGHGNVALSIVRLPGMNGASRESQRFLIVHTAIQPSPTSSVREGSSCTGAADCGDVRTVVDRGQAVERRRQLTMERLPTTEPPV